jgi:hypothetical protein
MAIDLFQKILSNLLPHIYLLSYEVHQIFYETLPLIDQSELLKKKRKI